jgi:hypothetical protein
MVLVQSNAGKMLSESQPQSPLTPAHNWRVITHSSHKTFWDLQSKNVIQHNPIQLHMQINLKKYLYKYSSKNKLKHELIHIKVTTGLMRGAGTGGTEPRTRTGSLVRGAATGGLGCGGGTGWARP